MKKKPKYILATIRRFYGESQSGQPIYICDRVPARKWPRKNRIKRRMAYVRALSPMRCTALNGSRAIRLWRENARDFMEFHNEATIMLSACADIIAVGV